MTTLQWLETPCRQGTTWGVPWPRGTVAEGTSFALADGTAVQSWTTATWPDGSIKWSAHAIGRSDQPESSYELVTGEPSAPAQPVCVERDGDEVRVASGDVTWLLKAPHLIASIQHSDQTVVRDVRLVSLRQDAPDEDLGGTRQQTTAIVDNLIVEQDGPVRAVVRLEGKHGDWLPFSVRLYFYAGAIDVRIVHSFVWDGDPDRDFLAGLGLSADVVMHDEPHNRHVRLAGPSGFLTEAVRGLTGLRRDPGDEAREAQVAGRAVEEIPNPEVSNRLHLIPQWNDYTLDQTSADGFTLRKRTGPGHAWVTIPAGTRSPGYGYVGGAAGGLGFGLRDFWKLHPTRLDIRNAATDLATATVWMWSPSAPAMDVRYWHDGMDQDSHAEQLEGLEITYEDYEPGYGNAHGIARTHELTLRVHNTTPSADELAEHAVLLNSPGLLAVSPARLLEAGVFGSWSLPTADDQDIEARLNFLFQYYVNQREQRRWYGFWDYGDVMHTYDRDRHTWRYDVGGFAWDNSELSPDLWLWYQYLRTGRADVFRFAEAMTRHTSEVDVHHLGRFKGLGSRHNVQHWGCSCKQVRISNAIYRRFYYYLTADERVGDLMNEVANVEEMFLVVDPQRKVRPDVYSPDPNALSIELGVDWGALAAAWLTRWERHGDNRARARLVGTMSDIAALHYGFLTGNARMDLSTGRFDTSRRGIAVSHLSSLFGLPEICSELIDLDLDVPGFEKAWLDYCRLYLLPPEQQAAEVGQPLQGISLVQAHSRLAAYAAARTGDAELARLAWRKFFLDEGDQLNRNAMQREAEWKTTTIDGCLMPVDEAAFVSTNGAAQYALAAIQNLSLIPEHRNDRGGMAWKTAQRSPDGQS
ncbi:Tat pathway signal sequence domain protein [Kribbella sp. NPDC050820]|uniref:exo-rhamnogalacturonan lyase family protein n=1 Tax=Kribbella sp. NPDC050820 TaxID=3155408 RepID=UPI0033E4B1E1